MTVSILIITLASLAFGMILGLICAHVTKDDVEERQLKRKVDLLEAKVVNYENNWRPKRQYKRDAKGRFVKSTDSKKDKQNDK